MNKGITILHGTFRAKQPLLFRQKTNRRSGIANTIVLVKSNQASELLRQIKFDGRSLRIGDLLHLESFLCFGISTQEEDTINKDITV